MADSTTYQILVETGKHAVLKLTDVSDGTGLSSVLVANVANLKFAYAIANTSSVFLETPNPGYNFVVGETVYVGGNVNSTAIVADYTTSALYLVTIANTAAWTQGSAIVGVTSNVTALLNANLVTGLSRVSIIGAAWMLPSGDKSIVLQWEDGTANTVALALSGQGDFNATLNPEYTIPNNSANATGNINLTTKGFVANDVYTVILDLRKVTGFQEPRTERNTIPGVIGR